jgi:hypothetical protein
MFVRYLYSNIKHLDTVVEHSAVSEPSARKLAIEPYRELLYSTSNPRSHPHNLNLWYMLLTFKHRSPTRPITQDVPSQVSVRHMCPMP